MNRVLMIVEPTYELSDRRYLLYKLNSIDDLMQLWPPVFEVFSLVALYFHRQFDLFASIVFLRSALCHLSFVHLRYRSPMNWSNLRLPIGQHLVWLAPVMVVMYLIRPMLLLFHHPIVVLYELSIIQKSKRIHRKSISCVICQPLNSIDLGDLPVQQCRFFWLHLYWCYYTVDTPPEYSFGHFDSFRVALESTSTVFGHPMRNHVHHNYSIL